MTVLLKPCCSTLPVRPWAPPPHYGPRVVELRDGSGRVVVTRKVPMSQWTKLGVAVGRYRLSAQGCSSAWVSVRRHEWSRRRLSCPVP